MTPVHQLPAADDCCMRAHASATPPWTCPCPCHQTPTDPDAVQRHRFTVWVDVPRSGDGWSQYPDYSADAVGRMLRRALHDRLELEVVVEHAKTTLLQD